MAKQFFKDLPDTTSPLTASRLNGLLGGEEALGNIVVDSIRSKNIFNYKMGSFEHSGTDVSLLDNGIKVIVNDSNATFPRANYFILDISNHLGKNITLTSTIDINSTAHPRIAIGTCDSTGENRNLLSYTDTEANGRKSVTATLPSSITSTTRYMFIGFYCAHGTAVSSGNYVNFTDIQLEFGSTATNYMPYQKLDGMETYSTEEQVIGTWLGKPLYRKVIGTTTSTTTAPETIGTINNLKYIINLYGFLMYSNQQIPLNFSYSNTVLNTIYMEDSNIRCKISANAYLSCTCYVIAEYTKTTD